MTKRNILVFAFAVSLIASLSVASAQEASTPSKKLSAQRGASHFPLNPGAYKPLEVNLTSIRSAKTPSIEQSMAVIGPGPLVHPGFQGPSSPAAVTQVPQGDTTSTRNFGLNKLGTLNHYSDNLVIGSTQYPYRTTGWLLFKQYNGTTSRCSAALISNSILLTAGHCVHKGGGGSPYWITQGVFAPAYTNGTLPYGVADVVATYTTSGWFNSGLLDQGYDVALVVLGKRSGTASEIGSYTGALSFCYQNCLQTYWMNTQVGYPSNYWGGNYMTESRHLEYSDTKDFRAGTGMQGGSSGGPHVANIGFLSDSSTYAGSYPYRNVANAVTSWGYTDQTVKIGGFSSLSGPGNSNNFRAMYNSACTYARQIHGAGSCTLIP